MRITTYFIVIGFLVLSLKGMAQTQEVTFTQITGKSGIPVGKVNAITHDQYGFVWFSDQTNRSLVKYDGTSMTRYTYDANDPNSMGGYYPENLFVDPAGVIWIGFFGQGLDRFDPQTETFTHYKHDPNDPESLIHNTVSWVIMDHLGMVWVGTDGGLDRLDPTTGKFTHFVHDPDDPYSLSGNTVRKVYEDSEGTIWVGVGFPYNDVDDGGLNRFDRKTEQFTRFMHDPEDPNSLKSNKTRAIFEDSKGNFWVGTDLNGLHWMDREKGTFQRFEFDPRNPTQLAPPPLVNEISHITFIEEDAAGHIWIGTPDNGIHRYNPSTGKVVPFGRNVSGVYPDPSGWVMHSLDNGLLWLGNQESNLYQVDIYTNRFPYEPLVLKDLFVESDSVLWYGTRDGLLREDLTTGEKVRYRHDPDDPTSVSHDVIDDILRDHQGNYWIATPDGLNQFDLETGVFTRYYHSETDPKSLSTNDLDRLYLDSQNNLWIGTQTGGLNKMNLSTLEVEESFQPVASNANSIRGRNTIDIIEDRNGLIWLAHFDNDGIDSYNPEEDIFTNYLFGLSGFALYIDHSDVLWAGTQNGFYRYDERTDSFQDQKIGTYVHSIIEDREHNLWLGTGDGIYRLDESRKHFVQFGKTSGVVESGRWWTNAAVEMPDGELLITENDGLYRFYPERVRTSQDSSVIYISEMLLDGTAKLKLSAETKILSADLNLSYSQNIFGLSFGEIDYRSSQENLIYCKLEGYDQGWREVFPRGVVNYFKVPSGTYELKVRASNASSGFETLRSININIAPPWWQTWWAYVMYTIAFAAGVFFVDRVQRRRLLAKERARSQARELEQAREIEKAYNQLKETQSQLIHSEKMASLGELTAGIAHEIQNPLNFVNNFSDVNKELIEELEEEIQKGDHEEIKSILKDLRENEEKVTHHGKRAEEIVKSMLQHSRGGEGEKELTDLNALCDEYLRLAYHGFRAKDQSFNCDYKLELDPHLPKLEVVPQDIGRVLLNLINNAFQAVADQDKAVVTITTNHSPSGGGQGEVQITITDNGPGIPDHIKDKIFQPFFTTKETGQGTGLGLSLSYDIVTKGHGGSIEVSSKNGEGTEFIVQLPIG